jgi:hypothetical protein
MQVKQHWRVVKLLLICSSKQQKLYFHGTDEQKQSLCIMPWDTCYLMIPCYSTCPRSQYNCYLVDISQQVCSCHALLM